MQISSPQLERHLNESESLRPVYLIAGEEPLLLLETADLLRHRARALGYSERDVLDVESGFDWNDLARAGASMSLFASRRIIELRLPTGKAGTEGAAAITEYCASVPSDVVLIIQAMQWSKAHEVKWVQTVDQVGVFARSVEDVALLAATCRFSNCTHESEPGCAVQAALAAGTLDAPRLKRFQKLQAEERQNTTALGQAKRPGRPSKRMR